ncbi:MAG TPA: hypothetical protein VHC20_05055 [Candidatus Paceibacterota bacterium]|nr:hypothetical protein [Candidatus Paceibacterota bacterium]
MSLQHARAFVNILRGHLEHRVRDVPGVSYVISGPMPMIVSTRHIMSAKEAGSGHGLVVYEPVGKKACFTDSDGKSIVGRLVLSLACLNDGTYAALIGSEGDVYQTPQFGAMNAYLLSALKGIQQDREFVAEWGIWLKPFARFFRSR